MKEQLLKTELQPDKPTLLLVDDDPLIAESLGFLLRKYFQVMVGSADFAKEQKISSISWKVANQKKSIAY